jgi:hypothetical protein
LALDQMTAFSVTPWAAERVERLIDECWRSMPHLLTICALHAGSVEWMQTGLPHVVESRRAALRHPGSQTRTAVSLQFG